MILILNDYYLKAVSVSTLITRALSLAVGKDENYLPSFCKNGDTISLMRVFHYDEKLIETDDDDVRERIGSSPHTDWGFLTVILQQESGLQLRYNEEWRDVPPREDALLVNLGDYLSLLTRGKFISPLHGGEKSTKHGKSPEVQETEECDNNRTR